MITREQEFSTKLSLMLGNQGTNQFVISYTNFRNQQLIVAISKALAAGDIKNQVESLFTSKSLFSTMLWSEISWTDVISLSLFGTDTKMLLSSKFAQNNDYTSVESDDIIHSKRRYPVLTPNHNFHGYRGHSTVNYAEVVQVLFRYTQ